MADLQNEPVATMNGQRRFHAVRADFRHVRVLLGCVLLLAAALKLWQFRRTPIDPWFGFVWLHALAVQYEIFLGAWLLMGTFPVALYRVAVVSFLLFAGVSLSKTLRGESTCGCFGVVELSPAWSVGLNAMVLVLLWSSQRSAYHSVAARWNRLSGTLAPGFSAGLALLLIWQVFLFNRGEATAQTPGDGVLQIRDLPNRGSFLQSEVTVLRHEDRVRAVEWSVVNTSGRLLRISIESPNCGCLGFALNGRRFDAGAVWPMPPRSSVRLGMIVPLRTIVGSYENQVDVVATAAESREIVLRRRLAARTEILRDVICRPPALQFTDADASTETEPATIRIDRLIRSERDWAVPSVVVEAESGAEPAFAVESCVALGPPKPREDGLRTARFRVQVTTVAARLSPDGKRYDDGALLRIRFGAPTGGSVVEETVPLLIVRSGR